MASSRLTSTVTLRFPQHPPPCCFVHFVPFCCMLFFSFYSRLILYLHFFSVTHYEDFVYLKYSMNPQYPASGSLSLSHGLPWYYSKFVTGNQSSHPVTRFSSNLTISNFKTPSQLCRPRFWKHLSLMRATSPVHSVTSCSPLIARCEEAVKSPTAPPPPPTSHFMPYFLSFSRYLVSLPGNWQ